MAQNRGLDLGLGVSDPRPEHHSHVFLQGAVRGVGRKLGRGDRAEASDVASASETDGT